MSILEAIIIGLIQGLTEFLPVSSSGHMMLAGRILDTEVSLAFELVLHLATLLAVVIFMRKDLIDLAKKPFCKKTGLIVAATIPTVIIVFFLRDSVEKIGGRLLPYCFIFTAILLLLSGFVTKKPKKEMTYRDAALIGVVQGLAAFPGLSRSGSTISASVLLGNDRESSANFSFLLSIPIIIGSSIVEILGGGLSSVAFLPLFFGFLTAFVSGYLAIRFMFRVLKLSFDYFAVYLLALSILLLLNDFLLKWF